MACNSDITIYLSWNITNIVRVWMRAGVPIFDGKSSNIGVGGDAVEAWIGRTENPKGKRNDGIFENPKVVNAHLYMYLLREKLKSVAKLNAKIGWLNACGRTRLLDNLCNDISQNWNFVVDFQYRIDLWMLTGLPPQNLNSFRFYFLCGATPWW